jgi:hypothetical protein
VRPYLKKPFTKNRAGEVAPDEGPEFKPQYRKKKKMKPEEQWEEGLMISDKSPFLTPRETKGAPNPSLCFPGQPDRGGSRIAGTLCWLCSTVKES